MSDFSYWSWGHKIQQSNTSSTTKLVLLNLSLYMNHVGEGCYPSTARQASDTGLSERTVCTHLELACQAGLLQKRPHGYSGKGWARNEYKALFPNLEEGTEPDDKSEVKALNLTTEGTEPDDNMALKEVQSNLPINIPKKNKKKNIQMPTLLEWEEINGRFSLKHLKSWGQKHNLDPDLVEEAIEPFRDSVLARLEVYRYSDFAAVFRNWHRKDMDKFKRTAQSKRML